MNNIQKNIELDIKNNKILLYMKGEQDAPMCGFSHLVVSILNEHNVEYTTRNVLKDDNLRQGIKEYSKWPTIPQLYINGEFVGGSDIVKEMNESGELQKLFNK